MNFNISLIHSFTYYFFLYFHWFFEFMILVSELYLNYVLCYYLFILLNFIPYDKPCYVVKVSQWKALGGVTLGTLISRVVQCVGDYENEMHHTRGGESRIVNFSTNKNETLNLKEKNKNLSKHGDQRWKHKYMLKTRYNRF